MTKPARRPLPFSAPIRAALISLAFTLLVSVPVLLFVYRQTDTLLEHRIRSRIDDRQDDLLYAYRHRGVAGLVEEVQEEIDTGMVRDGAVLLVDSSGKKIAGNLTAWPASIPAEKNWIEIRLYTERSRQSTLFALRSLPLPTGERVLLGTSVEERDRMRASLFEALIAALLLAVPLGLISGLVLLRITERRARAVGRVAAQIAGGDFSHRLDERAEGAEFGPVASAINAMLARIEELVEQLRLVTDSLAHDLRSPLMRMQANIEKAAGYAAADPEQQALEAISMDIDRVLRLISTTLEISRAEAGVGHEQFTDFDLGDLLRDICEIYQPIAEDRGLPIETDGSVAIHYVGNRQMIGRAVANLIDNALKYADGAGPIRLALEDHADRVEIIVSDRGPGISPELREDAVRKYRRLEEARTTEGSGLGLALVRAVARLHGGEILLEDNHPGLKVRLILRRQ
ncbi:MAG: HAMP domain-containing protein [Sphingomonas sp.]|nr:HAMP domain-containing protein [Sphingomonas sp.]